jgi:histidinol-phosphate aminotransferase
VVVRVSDANRIFDGLKARRILIKNLHGWHPLLSNCLRITVGKPEENDLVLSALHELETSRESAREPVK